MIDRHTDLLTSLLTQLTYQGQLDEGFKLEYNYLEVPSEFYVPEIAKPSVVFRLEGEMFESVKDWNIKMVSRKIEEWLIKDKELIDKIRQTEDSSVKLKLMREYQLMESSFNMTETHSNISHKILNNLNEKDHLEFFQIEQDILSGELEELNEIVSFWVLDKQPLQKIYRILCIESLVNDGIEEKVYEEIRKDIVESYGYEQIEIFSKMEKAGLLSKRFKKNTKKGEKSLFRSLQDSFGLYKELSENVNPKELNLPYDQYVPLSYKLFETAVTDGWRNPLIRTLVPGHTEIHGNVENAIASLTKKKVILLYMIGGITYSEVAYMRDLAERINIELIIATTNIIKSTDVIGEFMQKDGKMEYEK